MSIPDGYLVVKETMYEEDTVVVVSKNKGSAEDKAKHLNDTKNPNLSDITYIVKPFYWEQNIDD